MECLICLACLVFLSDLRAAQQHSNAGNMANERFKRAFTMACPCLSDFSASVPTPTVFFFSNGRCYAVFTYGAVNYTDAQAFCKVVAKPNSSGRLATFDSADDFNFVASWLPNLPTGNEQDLAWIGLNNLQWNDPNTPSCPPPLNATDFQTNLSMIIPPNTTIGAGPFNQWHNWTAISTPINQLLCEIGMNVAS